MVDLKRQAELRDAIELMYFAYRSFTDGPDRILERKKVGFRVPVNKWFQGPLKEYLCDHLRGSESKTRAYYDPQVLDRMVDDHIDGRQNHEKLLWALLNLEIWHRQYA